METGEIVEWSKKEGDSVNVGDILYVVKTDKAEISVEAEEDGILAKIFVPAPSSGVPLLTVIGLMVEPDDDWKNVEIPADAGRIQGDMGSGEKLDAAPAVGTDSEMSSSEHFSDLSPAVRRLAEEYNVNTGQVTASGPHDRIIKEDVLGFIKQESLTKLDLLSSAPPPVVPPPPDTVPPVMSSLPGGGVKAPSPPQPRPTRQKYTDVPHTNMRKTIAKRLTESKMGIPHSYATMQCCINDAISARKQLLEQGIKISMNDIIIKATALALQRVPRVNCLYQGDTTQMCSSVDISVAVATDSGLITPIIKNAPYLSVDEINATVKELAGRAREGKLQLNEFQGGTFTISNLGMFGISEFSAIISPPQGAILAVGTSRVLPGHDGKPSSVMTVQLSYDSRAINDVDASLFLETFRSLVEAPVLLIGAGKARLAQEV